MDKQSPLRSLPRVFLPGADLSGSVELPKEEQDKLHKVLRLKQGDKIAVLPNDGSLWVCEYRARSAVPIRQEWPGTEPAIRLTLAQALPKGDRLDTIVRMGTELGVARFLLFPAERSVVRWEPAKLEAKLARLRAIAREAAEQSFRCRLPEIVSLPSLEAVLKASPEAVVLSEVEGVPRSLAAEWKHRQDKGAMEATIVVGPEGGWSPRELALIGDHGVSLGPLVLRTDTAGTAAVAALLIGASG